VLAMAVSQWVMTVLMVITPLHMSHHNHDVDAISVVIMAHTLGMFALAGVTGWLLDRVGRAPVIIGGGALLVAASLLAPLSTGVPLLGLSMFLLGLGWNFSFIAGSALLSSLLLQSERGRAQGLGEAAVALGAGAGSLASGRLFARGDIQAVAYLGLGLSLVLLLATLWAYRPGRTGAAVRLPAGPEAETGD
ncbi:MAG: MFS transporter, partial [Candidatus Promineifilaceae bacterium]